MQLETRFFVGNIPENINKVDLHAAFSKFGHVTNIDFKEKAEEVPRRNFAFVTLSAGNFNVDSCLKHFSSHDVKGSRLYVARARESFLERLQKEREAQNAKNNINTAVPEKNPIINLGTKLNPRKGSYEKPQQKIRNKNENQQVTVEKSNTDMLNDEQALKRIHADKKRLESLRKKRQEFKQQCNIIRAALLETDKVKNKKIVFDGDDEPKSKMKKYNFNDKQNTKTNKNIQVLFESDFSSDEFDFEIKKQFEGKKGQKVLDLQSSYKSDKRFTLDERFVEEEDSENESREENVEIGQEDEKVKQLNILQDVLGVPIKTNVDPSTKKTKSKMGMLRFDPTQPEHTKFLAPMEQPTETQKRGKKKKNKEKDDIEAQPEHAPQEVSKVEVSKEQFYKVSENLKEAIAQPTTFSLRSLFKKKEDDEVSNDGDKKEQETIQLKIAKTEKRKNPLDTTERNPFVYDSSDSEDEKVEENIKDDIPTQEGTVVWRPTLFFTENDQRLKEGIEFFKKTSGNEIPKDRRELKSLMKKRLYNKERKNQMFKKKIGGKRKSMKKSFRKKT